MVWQVMAGGAVVGGVLGYMYDHSDNKDGLRYAKAGAIGGAAIGAIAGLVGTYEAAIGAVIAAGSLHHKGPEYDSDNAQKLFALSMLAGIVLFRGYQAFGGPVPALSGLKR